MTDVIQEIVNYHNARRRIAVTDIKAAKKWAKISPDIQQMLINNVFCSKCGVTTIVDYALHNDRFGVVLKGKCKSAEGISQDLLRMNRKAGLQFQKMNCLYPK